MVVHSTKHCLLRIVQYCAMLCYILYDLILSYIMGCCIIYVILYYVVCYYSACKACMRCCCFGEGVGDRR